jgi:PAS domain S-box-containing protein
MSEKLKIFRALIENSADAIHVVDPATGRFLDVNESGCRALGYTRDEHLALTVFDVVEIDRAFFHATIARAKKAGHATVEVLHRRKDGTTYPVEVSLSPVTLDREYLLAVARDVTERKKAEEMLLQTRFCMEHAGDGIFWLSPEGRLLYVNKSARQRLGYSESELLGMNIFDLDPDFRPGAWGTHWEKLKQLGTMTFETRHRTKAGEVYPVEVNANCVRVGGRELNFAFTREITGRKQAEETMRLSREEFKDLFDNAPVGFHEVDTEGRLIRINNTELKMLGYSAGELLGQFVWKISADEEASRRAALAKLAGEPPPPEGFERMFRRKDGSIFPVWINDRLLKREDGVITGIRAAIQDITERERVEEAVRESKRRFQTLTTISPVGIFRTDAQGQTTYVNSRWCEISGLSAPDALGDGWLRAVHLEDRERLAQGWQAATRAQSASKTDYRFVHPDGTISWVMGQAVPEKDDAGHIVGYVGTITDITERKRVEAELKRERDLWQTLLDNSPDSIYFKDTQSRFVKCSKAQARQFGMKSPDDMVGKTDFDFYPEAQARSRFEDEKEIIRTGRPIIAKEEWEERKSGQIIWKSSTKMPWLDGDGKIIGIMGISRDITERKQVEADLKRERDLWRSLLDNSPDKIYFKDTQSRFVKCSQAMTDQFGVESPDELAGKTDFDFFDEAHARPAFEDEQEIIRTGRVMIDKEEREESKDGRVTWVTSTKLPWLDAAGKVIGIMGISRDITERKQTELALRDNEAFLNTVIEKIPHMIFVKDAKELRFVKFNEAGQEMLGYSLAELVGKNDYDFFPKELADSFTEKDRQVLNGKEVVDIPEESVQTRSKGERILHTKKIPIFDNAGQLVYLLGVSEDITEQKRAERQLRQLSGAVEHSPASIVITDMAGNIEYVNPKFTAVTGYSSGEVIGKNPRVLKSGEMPAGEYERLWQTITSGREWRGEFHNRKKNGELFWESASISAIFDDSGKIAHFVAVKEDITEKKKLEAQFLRAQRMESIGTLAGGIAHDLNNVLAPLLISVELLRDKITDTDGQRILAMLETNVNRGADLVKQVLAFGRGIKGERVMVQPKHLGHEIEQIVRETFPKSVSFEIHCAADLWAINGDPTQVEQVLLNLCVNARDAMPGGGTLSLHMENRVLGEDYAAANLEARSGSYVVISVTDTGAGMTREIQDRIFEPFFTTKEQGKGTGLGLSTTLAIVKSHGGFINCYSEAGRGSVFKVYLPASPGAAAVGKAAANQSSLPRGHNGLVLVVDDEEPIRNLAQTMLERFGYRVLLAANGAEAVKLYTSRQNEIALVITDMAMPVMDGPATIAALQAINPKVKVIGSSGLEMSGGATGIINAGLPHFMSKPYTAESMLNLVHEVLRENPVK